MINLMIKRFAPLIPAVGFLLTASSVLAQSTIDIKQPAIGIPGSTPIGTVVGNAVTVVLIFAALAVLLYLIIGAFQWITSGGDKENVAKARGRIIAALTGLLVLALAFLIARLAGFVAGFDLFNLPCIPSLREGFGSPSPSQAGKGC